MNIMRKCPFTVAGVLSIGLLTAPVAAEVINVPGDEPTIQAGIDAAAPGDEVVVADGTYTGPGNVDLVLDKVITVSSANGPDFTTIDGGNAARAFVITANATVMGFTMTNGFTTTLGGAMLIESAAPTITDCHFLNNKAKWAGPEDPDSLGRGGAIYCIAANPVIGDCAFTGNVAEAVNPDAPPFPDPAEAKGLGGAIVFGGGSSGTLSGCSFDGNEALSPGLGGNSVGGAILVAAGGNATVGDCSFSGNFASIAGGAFWVESATATITGCSFDGNSAQSAGAIAGFAFAGLTIADCDFVGNFTLEDIVFIVPGAQEQIGGGAVAAVLFTTADISGCDFVGNDSRAGRGGAVSTTWDTATSLVACEFLDNSAYLAGGAVFNGALPALAGGPSTTTMEYCLAACNSAPLGAGIANTEASTMSMTNCTVGHNAASIGGGLANMDMGSTTDVLNGILWGNCSYLGPLGSQILDGPGGVTVGWSIVQRGWPGTEILSQNPRWVDASEEQCPDGNDYRLSRKSPAIGAGEDGVDMGAFPFLEE